MYRGEENDYAPAAARSDNPEVRRFNTNEASLWLMKNEAGRCPMKRCFATQKFSPRNQKRFNSRYNFGYGILLYIRKMTCFRPLTAYFGGFEGVFSYINDKSAFACPGKTEVADFVRLRVQSFTELILKITLKYDIIYSLTEMTFS